MGVKVLKNNDEIKKRLIYLRDTAYNEMLRLLKEYGKCHLTCLTGFGKSVIARRFIQEHPHERVLYVTDRKDASDIMAEYAKQYNKGNDSKTYAYLSRDEKFDEKLDYIAEFTILIFDESHLMGAHNCDKIVKLAKQHNIKLIGASASPLRSDGLDVSYALFDGHVIEYTMLRAIKDGFMKPPLTITTVYLAIRIKSLLEEAKNKPGGKWAISQLTGMERAIAGRDNFTGVIKRAVDVVGKGIWIVFHPNIKALNIMRPEIDNVFNNLYKDVKTFAVSSDEQHLTVREFIEKHKGFSIVHSVDMMTTGWHFTDIVGLIINSMTYSPVKSIQQLGRGIELGTGKRTAVIDIIGRFSSQKNRFIEDIEEAISDSEEGSDGIEKETREIEEPCQYDVETQELEIHFEKILDAIEIWINGGDYRLTPEQAVYTIRKFNHTLKTAYKACGVPEEILKEMVAEANKNEEIIL